MTLEEARQSLTSLLGRWSWFRGVEIVGNEGLRVLSWWPAQDKWAVVPATWEGYPILGIRVGEPALRRPTVTFNAQGEFQASPEELPLLIPPAVTVYSRTELSRLMQKQGWGYELPTNAREALSRHVDKAVAWTGADSGSLLRMATATEAMQQQLKQVTEQLGQVVKGLQRLETVLVTCLQPALKLAAAEKRQRLQHLLDKWCQLIKEKQQHHGPCPAALLSWLASAFNNLEYAIDYLRGYRVTPGGSIHYLSWEDMDEAIDALPIPTRGKMKKLYAAWTAGVKEPTP